MRPPLRLLLCTLPCLACSTVQIEVQMAPTGRVTSTIGEPTPQQVRPAHIYEIDRQAADLVHAS